MIIMILEELKVIYFVVVIFVTFLGALVVVYLYVIVALKITSVGRRFYKRPFVKYLIPFATMVTSALSSRLWSLRTMRTTRIFLRVAFSPPDAVRIS